MKNVTDDVNKLIESNDNWLNSVGYKIIKHHVTPENIELLESTFIEMRKKGVNEYPYKVGEYLASCLLENQDIYKRLLLNFEDENDNFKQAVLQTFSMIEKLPLKVEEFILTTICKSQEDVRSLAVLASGNCKKLRKEAIKQLIDELSSQYWYVRGNAATSLAKLQVTDVEIISKIITLFGDIEGCDWTAEESAIRAVTTIGRPAKICIPELLKLLRSELHGRCDEIYITDICEALRKIDDGSELVITVLIEVVEKCEDEAFTSAVRALGRLGEKSKRVLGVLKERLNYKDGFEADFVDDDRAEIILVKNIYKIGGTESNLFKSYLMELKSHTDKEIQQAVIDFEKSINLQ